jgi:hypothetical protein
MSYLAHSQRYQKPCCEVVKIKSLYENFKNFPRTDCGYCGNASCITMLRRFCSGELPISECIYFRAGLYNEKDFSCSPPVPKEPQKPTISYIRPCPTDSERITVEVSLLAPENSKFGYFDMITAEKIFDQVVPGLRISPSLGIARLESEWGDVMGFSEGRVLIRRAANESGAFRQLSKFVRLLWAAVS